MKGFMKYNPATERFECECGASFFDSNFPEKTPNCTRNDSGFWVPCPNCYVADPDKPKSLAQLAYEHWASFMQEHGLIDKVPPWEIMFPKAREAWKETVDLILILSVD